MLQHWEPDNPDDPASELGHEIDVTIRISLKVDVVRLGATLGEFGKALQLLQNQDVPAEQKIETLDSELPKVRHAIREMVLPPDRAGWDKVAPDLDAQTLGKVIRYITNELSGLDPTPPASSSDGSPTDGVTSTDGALPAPSTSAASPPPEL